jgi:hypothetical protein
VSHGQLKVISAIERCRMAAPGGHVERCEACAQVRIATTPAATGTVRSVRPLLSRSGWPTARPNCCRSYFHAVFTLPGPIVDIAYQN